MMARERALPGIRRLLPNRLTEDLKKIRSGIVMQGDEIRSCSYARIPGQCRQIWCDYPQTEDLRGFPHGRHTTQPTDQCELLRYKEVKRQLTLPRRSHAPFLYPPLLLGAAAIHQRQLTATE